VSRSNPLHAALSLAGKVLGHLYVRVVRGSFAAWGPGSRIGRGATLVAPHLVEVGSGVVVGEQAWLNAKDDRGDGAPTLHIGDRSYIGRFVHINAWRSVTIGRDVLIADRVFISDADHRYDDVDTPIAQQGDAFVGEVVLREGCWIGIGAVILPGVTIGRNAVVAANAVVTRSIPDRSVAAGVPARVIVSR
jgi:acetyltransferase-like isoleucine patch superfamily enzyme